MSGQKGGHVAAAGGRRAGAVEGIHGYDTDRDDGENAGGSEAKKQLRSATRCADERERQLSKRVESGEIDTVRVAGGASGADAGGQPYTKRIEDASET
eukprot:2239763-Pleurochrysis_carterae.AAC.1